MIPRPVLAVGLGVFTTTILVMIFWGALSIYSVTAARDAGDPPAANPLPELSRLQLAIVISVETLAALAGAVVTAAVAREGVWQCLYVLAAMFLLGGLTSLLNETDGYLPRTVLATRVLLCPLAVFGIGWVARQRSRRDPHELTTDTRQIPHGGPSG